MTGISKPIDFHQAAKRHFYDADLLMDHNRQATAGQLYGFTAECGIKSLLVWKGYPTDPKSGELAEKGKRFRVHIHELVNNINMLHTFLDGRGAAKYLALMPSIWDFSDWKIDHRYYVESALPPSASKWREASREILQALDEATLDGEII
jgi:hypothetical protein